MSSEREYPKISLLVRNLPLDVTAEELKDKICKYGEVRDCYLPRDFHTQRPRGFGFVEFAGDRRDAEDAIKALDGSDFRGREITVCFSREARKTPREMLHRDESYRGPERGRDSRDGRDRRSRSRSPRRDRSSRRHSRSPRRERRNNSRSASRSPVRRRRRSPSRSPVPRRSPRRSPHRSPQAPSRRSRSASPPRRARSPEDPPRSPENAPRSEQQQ